MKSKLLLGVAAAAFAVLGLVSFTTKPAGAQKSVFGNRSEEDVERVKKLSLDLLKNELKGNLIAVADDLTVQSVEFDEYDMAHTRVRQTVNGIPVWQGEAIVHLKSDGTLASVTDDLKDVVATSTQPNISPQFAIQLAIKHTQMTDLTAKPKADLWVLERKERNYLTYRVELRREDGTKHTSILIVFVDAQTGEMVDKYENLQTATGTSLYSGNVTIGTTGSGSTYYLEDTARKVGTLNFANTTTSAYRFVDSDNIWNSSVQKAGVDAHYGATMTLNYFQAIHARNGIDGRGGPFATTSAIGGTGLITSVVHYATGYNNAFWNGSYMTYGDGDGSVFSPLTTLDICGHEMTHGITERTAGLVYSGESGALNEAMSDIFGAMVERYARGENANTWKLGEQAYTPAIYGDALRYFDNPVSGGQPAHYDDRYTGASDNGGVHINSGIANYAFYLMSKGGTTSRGYTVSGTNANEMAKIWYRALVVYMTSGTNFAGARVATLNAAADIYGTSSTQYQAVTDGWCAVGVGTCAGGGGTPTPTPTPTATPTPTPTPTPAPTATPTPTPTPTPAPSSPERVLNGGFETVLSPWVKTGTGAFNTASGTPAHGGTGFVYLGGGNSLTGTVVQQVTIPSNSTALFSFWLNVVSNETTTTGQYDKLFVEVLNSSGAVLATPAVYSNLNKGASGAYVQKTLDLAAFRGKTIKIQFRVVTDGSTTTTFRVDDVSLR